MSLGTAETARYSNAVQACQCHGPSYLIAEVPLLFCLDGVRFNDRSKLGDLPLYFVKFF